MTDSRLDDRGFLWASAVLVACVAPHVPRFPWWLTLGLATLLLLRILQRRRMGVAVPKPIRLVLVLALTLLIGWYYGSLVGRHAGSALLTTMLVLKLMESERRRDARIVAVFSVFVLLTQFLFSESLTLTLYVAFCTVLIFAGLREFAEPRQASARGWRSQLVQTWRQRLRPTLRVAVLAVPLTVFLFMLFPRLGAPLWGAPLDPAGGRTGISDSMAPGDISLLLADDSPAFRVNVLEGTMPAPDRRFWRGPVLWNFDGRAWTRQSYLFNNIEAAEVEPRAPLLRYQLTMEATEQPWVLALDVPLSAPRGLQLGADQVMRSRRPLLRASRWELVSAPAYRMESELRMTWRRIALELPEGYNPRTLALARDWRAEHGSDDEAIIGRALDWFNREFIYSLAPPLLGRDSVDDFLFATRNGFCEHYSSAFTVLMRAAGIPARVVTGYMGGRYNPLGDYWLVLQSDAHAWSEVWLEGRGWVRVDPTAAVAPERILSERGAAGPNAGTESSQPWWRGLSDIGDWIGHRWVTAILDFDALRQRNVLRPLGIPDANWRDLGLALVAVFSLLSAVWLWLALRGARRSHDPLLGAWRSLDRRLATVGLARQRNEGPEAWIERAIQALPHEAHRLRTLRGHFIALRYRTSAPDRADIDAFRRAVAAYRPRRSRAAMGGPQPST